MTQEASQNNTQHLPAEKSSEEPALDYVASTNDSVCQNCGVNLHGPYCHQCGQSSKSMVRYFWVLIRELLNDLLGYDSRLKKTVFPLLFKPGRLSLDYVEGKRSSYVLPVRPYLIMSLLLMLAIKINTDPTQMISEGSSGGAVLDLDAAFGDSTSQSQNAGNSDKGADENADKDSVKDDEKDNKAKQTNNDVNVENLSNNELTSSQDKNNSTDETTEQKSKDSVESFFQQVSDKWQEQKHNPERIIKEIIELLPYMMFILLPLYALFLKLAYVFSKRFYIEHLIFLLHNHCFLYFALIIQFVLDGIHGNLKGSDSWLASALASSADWLSMILGWWIVIYILLAMKRFYQQGWALTLLKSVFLSSVYLTMIVFGFAAVAVIGTFLS